MHPCVQVLRDARGGRDPAVHAVLKFLQLVPANCMVEDAVAITLQFTTLRSTCMQVIQRLIAVTILRSVTHP